PERRNRPPCALSLSPPLRFAYIISHSSPNISREVSSLLFLNRACKRLAFRLLLQPSFAGQQSSTMEAMKMRLFLAVVIAVMAVSAVQSVSAAEAPAPSPASDAPAFVPAVLASVIGALAFGLFV
ncbi:hypothetical protein EUGRSUZ_K01501, partial [Eucalyptus grandis]